MPLTFIRDDITRVSVDAIVNFTCKSLFNGDDVYAAIHRAAGPELIEECRTIKLCDIGDAKITKAYNLPAKYVIHAVSPVYTNGNSEEESDLRFCFATSLSLASGYGLTSIAFPLGSAGIYGCPTEKAITIALEAIRSFLNWDNNDIEVILVLLDEDVSLLQKELLKDLQKQIGKKKEITPDEEEGKRRIGTRIRDFFHRRHQEESGNQHVTPPEIPLPSAPMPPTPPMPALPSEAAPMASAPPRPAAPYNGAPMPSAPYHSANKELTNLLIRRPEGFTETLLRMIDERGMSDVECYKKANIDRKLFSKIRSDFNYHPRKTTVCAFSIALKLSLEETDTLLRKAGYAFSESNEADIIVKYYIEHGRYDIFEINEALFEFDQVLLGA